MAKRVETNSVKSTGSDDKKSGTLEVILKCSYPMKDKDGKFLREAGKDDKLGKIKKHKPDDKVRLPYAEATDLISRAFAVKA